MKKKIIVHVITRLMNGGADENTVLTCNYSFEKGDKVILISGKARDKEILSKLDSNIDIIFVKNLINRINPINDFLALVELIKIIKKISPDVVHTHSSKAGILGRLAAKLNNTKLIVHTVHSLPFVNSNFITKFFYLFMERFASLFTHKIINVSEGTKKIYLRYGIGKVHNHHVIFSGFDVDKFKNSKKSDLIKNLNIGSSLKLQKIIVRIGRFEKLKRYKDLILVYKKVLQKFPNTYLILVGNGELLDECKILTKKLKLEKNIIFTGFVNDPEKIIALSDICIMNSEREGLSKAMLQYFASGKPVISSNIYGVDEVLKNNVNGCIFNVNDNNDLYNKIVHLLSNEDYLRKLTYGAKETDISKWSIKSMGEKIDNLYNSELFF